MATKNIATTGDSLTGFHAHELFDLMIRSMKEFLEAKRKKEEINSQG